MSRGETLGIVGESGSGKSVTCYSLLGLIPKPPGKIVSGHANFGGVDLLNCPESELRQIRAQYLDMDHPPAAPVGSLQGRSTVPQVTR